MNKEMRKLDKTKALEFLDFLRDMISRSEEMILFKITQYNHLIEAGEKLKRDRWVNISLEGKVRMPSKDDQEGGKEMLERKVLLNRIRNVETDIASFKYILQTSPNHIDPRLLDEWRERTWKIISWLEEWVDDTYDYIWQAKWEVKGGQMRGGDNG